MLLRFIKDWYQKMSMRERGMFIAFVWVIVLGWLGYLAHKIGHLRDDIKTVQTAATNQKLVLDQQNAIQTNLSQMFSRFDKANVIDAPHLFQMIAQFAKDSSLDGPNTSIQQQRSQTADIFTINTVSVHFSKASIHDLVNFASKIEDKTPYLAIDDISITPSPILPNQLDATLRVSSLELNQSINSTDVKH